MFVQNPPGQVPVWQQKPVAHWALLEHSAPNCPSAARGARGLGPQKQPPNDVPTSVATNAIRIIEGGVMAEIPIPIE